MIKNIEIYLKIKNINVILIGLDKIFLVILI